MTQDSKPLSTFERYLAGILLIFFIIAPAYFIIAHWPDRIPGPRDNFKPLYINEPFHVRLAYVPDSACCPDTVYPRPPIKKETVSTAADTTKKPGQPHTDSPAVKAVDSEQTRATRDAAKQWAAAGHPVYYLVTDLLDLNILVLMLVAAGGFLGNMVYVATSFTTFVGSDKFSRSWLLWYFVKPFTAAALALGLYFVFRGGFLNYAEDASGINLYGVITIAILAGLFTDKATLKLKEIFEVIFTLKKDERTGTLAPPQFKFSAVTPTKLSKTDKNSIVITGENFDKGSLHFTINSVLIPADQITKSSTNITIIYSVPAAQADATAFNLIITDDQDKILFKQAFTV
jgi:hypothetical protein